MEGEVKLLDKDKILIEFSRGRKRFAVNLDGIITVEESDFGPQNHNFHTLVNGSEVDQSYEQVVGCLAHHGVKVDRSLVK